MEPDRKSQYQLTLRGRPISEDERGWINLDDIWSVAEAATTKRPAYWRVGKAASSLVKALAEKIGISGNKQKNDVKSVIYAKRGQGNKGTFAHPVIAAAYAGYLSPALEVEVREVWLRYRAGDATLADEILQRASAEDNHWAGVRALARSNRVKFTDVLKAHGVADRGYMECTEATYERLLGGTSWQLRAERNLPKKANLRDHLKADELAFVMAAESLAAERIVDERRHGNAGCREASALGAAAIRSAIEADRRSRQYAPGLRRM